MASNTVYFATTNHGFGHTTRTVAVVAEVQKLLPEIKIIMGTTAPRWLLEQYIQGDFLHRKAPLDVGVIQSDSLTVDKSATLKELRKLREKEALIIESEIDFVRQHQVSLILADIPPLAVKVAHGANLPCLMTSNFGWDFIYRDWGQEFSEIADWISSSYCKCDHLLRIPFHEPMSSFSTITDVGLTGGSPRYSVETLKSIFNLKKPLDKTILLTFGGGGLKKIPYSNIESFPDLQFITFDNEAPKYPNLLKITDRQYRPVDFMPLCNRIISKPGYSTFAEACRLGVPVTSITRKDFAESVPLLQGLRNYAYHQILTPSDFFNGNWDFLREPMSPPQTSQTLPKNGNEEIAQAIVNYLLTD